MSLDLSIGGSQAASASQNDPKSDSNPGKSPVQLRVEQKQLLAQQQMLLVLAQQQIASDYELGLMPFSDTQRQWQVIEDQKLLLAQQKQLATQDNMRNELALIVQHEALIVRQEQLLQQRPMSGANARYAEDLGQLAREHELIVQQQEALADAQLADVKSGKDITGQTGAGRSPDPLAAQAELFKAWLPLQLTAQAYLSMVGSDAGVPGIAPPIECSLEELTDFMTELSGKTNRAQMDMAREGLKTNEKKLQDQHAEIKKKFEEFVKNAVDSYKNDKSSSALKWFKRIAMPLAAVLSVALTVVTLGAASPLAVLALGMTAYGLTQQVLEETGGPSIGIADRLAEGLGKAFHEMGMSEEDAKKYGTLVSGVVAVVAAVAMLVAARNGNSVGAIGQAAKTLVALDPKFVGNLAGGAAAVGGASDKDTAILNGAFTMATQLSVGVGMGLSVAGGAKSLTGLAAKAVQAGTLVQSSLSVANGATGSASAALSIETSNAQEAADKAQADSKLLEAQLADQQAMQEMLAGFLKSVLENVEAVHGMLADTHKNYNQGHDQIIGNLKAFS